MAKRRTDPMMARAVPVGLPPTPRVRNGVILIVAALVMASAALYIFTLVG